MSNEYSPSRPRGGRRGRRRGRRGQSQTQKPNSSNAKPSFWSKIAAFFGVRPKSSSPERPEKRAAERGGAKPPRREPDKPSAAQKENRPPARLEVTSPRLYVGNLSFDATESDLHELFSGAGSVVNVEIVCSRQTQRSKGFGFVQMQTIEEARRAVEELHDKEYMGRKLLVSGAKPLEPRADRSSQPEQ